MTAKRHTLIGLFFVAVTGVLGWFTLFKSDLTLFSESFPMTAYFEEGGGLREGDSVLVAGMRWGSVTTMEFNPDSENRNRRVKVQFSLERVVALYGDYEIQIEDATVLGGKRLSIEPGSSHEGAWEGTLLGTVKPNVMEAVGALVRANSEKLSRTITRLEEATLDYEQGGGVLHLLLSDAVMAEDLKRAVTKVADTFENLEVLTDETGPLGQLLADAEMFAQIKVIVGELKVVMERLGNNEGILGALLDETDPMLAEAREGVTKLKDIITGVEAGEGVVGLLFKDEETREILRVLVDNLNQGRGTIGKLLNDEEVYDSLKSITDNLVTVTDKVNSNTGTIGKLVNDDELYLELLSAVRLLTGSLEEAREAAPISTFLNTVFLGF